MNDIMLDIETMGNGSCSSIVSIGAVEFDINTGKTGKTFYLGVDLQSCLDAGLKVDASTVYWWLGQSDEARAAICKKGASLSSALISFSAFCDKTKNIWGNSARFDMGILSDAYRVIGLGLPWDFRNERDVRTLVAFAPEIKKKAVFKGTEHNPIDDCKFQIQYCSKIWKSLI